MNISSHDEQINQQFTQQAELFANASALHGRDALDLLVDSASPEPSDKSLDVACGPGTVAVAFAERVQHATGLDATGAMLEQAKQLAEKKKMANTTWQEGNVYNLPFDNDSFDIVSCRFAFHHFEDPVKAFSEMNRVCKPGGRIVVCDAVVSDDPSKAKSFNDMERFRDPSTVEFRTLKYLSNLFINEGLAAPDKTFYRISAEVEALLKTSFPLNDDYDGLRKMIGESVEGDAMGANARRDGDKVWFDYNAAILVSKK